MQIIGLSGYARSGKDTVAEVLVANGWERIAFADKLRDFLYALNPIVEIGVDNEYIRLRDVIDHFGWDGYKDTPYVSEIRPLLQRLGTEAGRQTLWDSIWIDAALHDLKSDGKYVITDCRFPNEAEAVRERGGEVIRVERRGVGPAVGPDGRAHASETSLDGYSFNYRIENDGTLEEFQNKIRGIFL